MTDMSAKVSNIYRQSKGRGVEGGSAKKASGGRFAAGNRATAETVEDSARDRELLVFDLTNKWGPCHGAKRQ